MPGNLLELDSVSKFYGSGERQFAALEDVSLSIANDEPSIVTVAGESGSGKTTLANLVLGFTVPSAGRVLFGGRDCAELRGRERRELYREVQAVFQDPFGIYNPFYRVGHVFDTVIRNFGLAEGGKGAAGMVEEALNVVGLTGADILRKYPHQLSGGQRQRVMMARAYLIKPRLVVADEPVSMVDASLRASILDVMMRLRDESGISFIYITHDLSTAYQVGDRILVMYQGRIAERGLATGVIGSPQHPYVQLLVESVPKPDPNDRWEEKVSLPPEESSRSPSLQGCRFADRCRHVMDRCRAETPELRKAGEGGQEAACHLY